MSTVPRRAYAALASAAEHAGYDLPLPELVDEEIDDTRFDAIWLALHARGADEGAVLTLASALPLGAVAPLDLAVATAGCVGDALDVVALGWWMVASPGEWMELKRTRHSVQLRVRHASRSSEDPRTDAFALAAILARLRAHAVDPVRPERTVVALTPGAPVRERFERFFDGAVEFGGASSAMHFTADAVAVPMRSRDAEVFALLRARVASAAEQGIAELRGALREQLEVATLASLARALGRSPRVVQRVLAASGTTFRVLRDEVRAEEARHLVGSSPETLAQIASRVGFADQATFTRAFSRWTGSSPDAFRRAARRKR